jgi:hypothetical protein
MLSKLIFAASAATLLLPSTVSACGMSGGGGGGADLLLLALFLPVFGVWAAADAAAAKVKSIKDHIRDNKKKRDDAKARGAKPDTTVSTELQQLFTKTEKEPTPSNLLACGLHFAMVEDYNNARMYLRRAIALAKENPEWEKDMKTLPIVAYAEYQSGLLKMRIQLYAQALHHFEEAYEIIGNKLGSSRKNNKAQKNVEPLTAEQVAAQLAWAKLHVAIYSGDSYQGDNRGARRLQDLNQAADSLEKLAAAVPEDSAGEKLEAECRAAIARFYQLAEKYSYRWGMTMQQRATTEGRSLVLENKTEPFKTEILPRFQHIIDKATSLHEKKQLDDDDTAELLGWSHYYAARCNYAIRNLKVARAHAAECKKFLPPNELKLSFEHVNESYKSAIEQPAHDKSTAEYDLQAFYDLVLSPHTNVRPDDASGTQGHSWKQRTFHRPSWCAYSKCQSPFITLEDMKVGTWICEHCGGRYHQKCKEACAESACIAVNEASQMEAHQHIMRKKTLFSPTWCSAPGCTAPLIKNMFGAHSCETCEITTHSECASKLKNAVVATS